MVGLFRARQERVPFEHFVGDLSLRLTEVDDANINSRLKSVMRDIGGRYDVDRVVLRWLPMDRPEADSRLLEVAAAWSRTSKPVPDFAPQDVPWFMRQARDGNPAFVDKISQIPSETDRRACRSRNIVSVAAMPLAIGTDLIGGLTLTGSRERQWTKSIRTEIELLGKIIANAYWTASARQSLLASEARYRAVVQDQSDMIIRWTPEGKITWVNERMCQYRGMSADELVGSTDLVCMTEDEWDGVQRYLKKLTPGNPTFNYNYRWEKPGGEVLWTEWTERGIFDEDGKLIEMQSVGRDVTERVMAEEALARQARFQTRLAEVSSTLLNALPDETDSVIADIQERIGVDYEFDRVNVTWYDHAMPGFGKAVTWTPDGTTGRRQIPDEFPHAYQALLQGNNYCFDDVDDLPEEAHIDRERFRQFGARSVLAVPLRIEESVFGGAAFVFHQPHRWDESTIEELQLIAHAITNAAVRQWSTIQITRREKDLARSQRVARVGSYRLQARRNEDASDNLLDILNLTMSDQALEIFGISPQEDPRAQVMSMLARIHPDDEPRVRETWRNTLQAGTEHTIEYRVVRPDGSIAHVQAKEQFDGIDSSGVITFFGTYNDITEWVEANTKLQTALLQIEALKDSLQEENILLRDEVRAAQGFDEIVGSSGQLRGVLESAAQVAPTDVTVLICGETGTGKELIARSIHELSHRSDRPMVAVNCAALSSELIESELFGHEKGAFTGAHSRRRGRFEIADGGTLFLDEIGEMSGDLQAKVLRVIQEGEFERLGGSRTLKTDVRLIAATNRDLVQAMDSGEFRADLYYRINAFPIVLPALRDRKEDIPMLAQHFVRKHQKELGKEIESISARMLRRLQERDWPGNIRELEGTIVRALISSSGRVLDYVDSDESSPEIKVDGADAVSLLDAQRKHIVDVLQRAGWVIEGKRGAAEVLGLAPSSLRSKMKRLNIVRPN